MRKLLTATLALVLAFGLTGCSDATTNVTDAKTPIFTIGKEELTNGELYETLVAQGPVSSIINLVTEQLIELEVPVTEEITKKAEEAMAELKEGLGDQFMDLIKAAGFDNEEDYFNERVMYATRSQELTTVYLTNNFEEASAIYSPRKVNIIEVKTKEDADAALTKLKEGTSFADVAEEYSDSEVYDGVSEIITKQSGLDATVFTKIKDAKENGLMPEVLANTDSSKFYLVNIEETNPENFKEDAIKALAATDGVADVAFEFFLKKYNFHIYDINILNAFEEQAPSFVIQTK